MTTRQERQKFKHWVYFLRDPRTFQVMYVGMTKDPAIRAVSHMQADSSNPLKAEWISGLKRKGKRVILDVVFGPFDHTVASRVEATLIASHIKLEHNLNGNAGARLKRSVKSDCDLVESFCSIVEDAVVSGRFPASVLAEKAGCSRNQIYKIINRESKIAWRVGESVLRVLGYGLVCCESELEATS